MKKECASLLSPSFSRRWALLFATLASQSIAADIKWEFSGKLWFDGYKQLSQHDPNGEAVSDVFRPEDRMEVTRASLDFVLLAPYGWELLSSVGFDKSHHPDVRDDAPFAPISDPTPEFEHFYARYTHDWAGQFSTGYIRVPGISANSEQPNIFLVNPNLYHVIFDVGARPGVSWMLDWDSCVIAAALWQHTPTQPIASVTDPSLGVTDFESFATTDFLDNFLLTSDYHSRLWKLGLNTQVHFYPVSTEEMGMAMNLGWQNRPLDAPVVFGVLGQEGDSTTAQYTFSVYNALNESSFEMLSYFKGLTLSTQVQYQVLGMVHDLAYGTVDTTDQSYRDIFRYDGYALGYSGQVGYLLGSGGYTFDRPTGRLKRYGSGWEFGVAYGAVVQKGATALLSPMGIQDYTSIEFGVINEDNYSTGAERVVSLTGPSISQEGLEYTYIAVDASAPREAFNEDVGFNALVGDSKVPFQTRTQSYTFFLNYAYNENLAMKVELETAQRQWQLFGDEVTLADGYIDSLVSARTQSLRLRTSYTF